MPLEDVGPSDSFTYEHPILDLVREIQDEEDENILDVIMSHANSNFGTPNHDRSHLGPLPPQYEAVEEKPLTRTRFERIVNA